MAERLFAEVPYEALSLRAITRQADTNIASVNYHFGSKDGLANAIIKQHLLPFDRWRRRCLDAVEGSADGPEMSARYIVDVMALPLLELWEHDEPAGRTFAALLARSFLTRTRDGWTREYQLVDHDSWTAALAVALPEFSPDERRIRWLVTVDALLVSLGRPLAADRSVPDTWAGVGMARYGPILLGYLAAGLAGEHYCPDQTGVTSQQRAELTGIVASTVLDRREG